MFCPQIKEECLKEKCIQWSNKYDNCLIALSNLYNAKNVIGWDEEDNAGLTAIKDNIYNTINKNAIQHLFRSEDIAEDDRKLLSKLWGEKESTEKIMHLKQNKG